MSGSLGLTFKIDASQLAKAVCEQNSYGEVSELMMRMTETLQDENLSLLTLVKILEWLVTFYDTEAQTLKEEELELTFAKMDGLEGQVAGECLTEAQQYLAASRHMLELARKLLSGQPEQVLSRHDPL